MDRISGELIDSIPQIHINSLFNSVSYRVGGALVDPGDDWEGFGEVSCVLLTHGHFDHIYGIDRVLELNPSAQVYTNAEAREMLLSDRKNMSRYHETPFVCHYPDRIVVVEDGQQIDIGNGLSATALFTPGHSPSCITWLIDDCLFSGDSLIPGIKTVTNLPGGNRRQAAESEQRIRRLLNAGKHLYPGHAV